MVFSSLLFLFRFLPIAITVYYLLPKPYRNGWLFLASLFFYGWGEPVYVLIMLFSTFFDYTNGRLMEGGSLRKKRAILLLSLVGNLGILFFFKYSGFFAEILSSIGLNLTVPRYTLPLGISFYTFQTLSYTIDVYRGKVGVCKNIIDFGLYVASFPQLIAGPIVKYSHVETQLQERKDTWDSVYEGGLIFLRGLFMKVLLANSFGELDSMIHYESAGSILTQSIKLFAYGFQIFFDFAGYSKMAIGLGRIFGFSFPENFNYPYMSKSITEFWRRWHMTLSSWFKEYVYIPLGGNRVGVGRHIFNLGLTWFLTGLWHGANGNFVLWGLYYFLLLVLEKYVLHRFLEKWPNILQRFYTLTAILFGWLLFTAEDLSMVGAFFRGLVERPLLDGEGLSLLLQYGSFFVLGILFSTPLVARTFDRFPRWLQHIVYLMLFVLAVASLVSGAYNPFLYFRF